MPRTVQLYAWCLALVGTALILLYPPHVPVSMMPSVFGIAVLAALFERFTITLPNRISFSLGATFVLLAYAYLGFAAALLVEIATAAVAVWQSKRLVQKAFNFGQLMVSVWVMHLATLVYGLGSNPFSIRGVTGLLLAGCAFFTVNSLLTSVVFWLMSPKRFHRVVVDIVSQSYVGIFASVGLMLPLFYSLMHGSWGGLLLNCAALLGFRYAVNLYLEQQRFHMDSLSKLAEVLEKRMGANGSHASRVAQLAKTMATLLKLPTAQIDSIHAAASLHDVGEAEVDQRVLSIMSRRAIPTLADEEEYRRHAAAGEDLVSRMEGMVQVAKLIRHHHEAWDGSGYPDGLQGEQIPLGARILAAAETIESLEPDLDTRLAAIPKLCGTVIDPQLAGVLSSALKKIGEPRTQVAAMVEAHEVTMLQNNVRQTLRSSQLLQTMGVAHVLTYEHGRFVNFMGDEVEPPEVQEVTRIAERAQRGMLPMRQHIVYQHSAYDVYCIPAGETAVSVLMFDVTQVLAAEREQTMHIFRAYRDVISVATGGKLVLVDDDECNELTGLGTCVGEVRLGSPADGSGAREMVREVAAACGMGSSQTFRLTVCVSEAVTNVFKHAGQGNVAFRRQGDTLRVTVSDQGDGIPYEILPHAILMEGYSTKRSLGKGFSVLLRYLDRVCLHTSPQGTTIVLEQRLTDSSSTKDEVPGITAAQEGGQQAC